MKWFILFVVSFLLISMVGAQYGNAQTNTNPSENAKTSNNSGIGQQLSQKIAQLREGNYTGPFGKFLNVKQLASGLKELRSNNVPAETELNITTEQDDNNQTKLKAHLSNGQEKEIKIMPDTASETAIARLKLKLCSEENNCTIELKEVGNSNETKAAYDVKAQKSVKVFGLFNAKMNVETNIDSETGDVISSKVPWWSSISADA
jgi:hypothetical protein